MVSGEVFMPAFAGDSYLELPSISFNSSKASSNGQLQIEMIYYSSQFNGESWYKKKECSDYWLSINFRYARVRPETRDISSDSILFSCTIDYVIPVQPTSHRHSHTDSCSDLPNNLFIRHFNQCSFKEILERFFMYLISRFDTLQRSKTWLQERKFHISWFEERSFSLLNASRWTNITDKVLPMIIHP